MTNKEGTKKAMERLALIGVSHRRGGAAALEAWQAHYQDTTLPEVLGKGFGEVVTIQTCNRCDIVVELGEFMTVAEAKAALAPPEWPRCYAYVGEGAVEQLTRIATSLDSLNPGEYQVMTQVREAFAAAEKAKCVGGHTRFAFTTAFKIAKAIRHQIEFAPLNTSLFSLARAPMEAHLPPQARIAILGMGQMGQLTARVLKERPDTALFFVNRSVDKAQDFTDAEGFEAEVFSLASFIEAPPQLDAVICATPVSQLLDAKLLDKLEGVKFLVDLGIPRNVDGKAATQRGIEVLDVDTLQQAGIERRLKIEANIAHAEELLLDLLDEAIGTWIENQLGSSIKGLREKYLNTVSTFSDDLDEKVQTRIASKMAHVPIKGLRAVAREYGLKAAQTFLKAADL